METDFLNEEHGDGGEEHGDGKRLSPVKGQPLCCILLCRQGQIMGKLCRIRACLCNAAEEEAEVSSSVEMEV